MAPMPATTLFANQEAVTQIGANDGATPPVAKPANCSATISDFSGAYVAVVGAGTLHFVAQAPGDYTVQVSGHSADGTALPDLTLSFHVDPVPVPQAEQLTATDPTVKNQDITTPPSPGTDVVTFSV